MSLGQLQAFRCHERMCEKVVLGLFLIRILGNFEG